MAPRLIRFLNTHTQNKYLSIRHFISTPIVEEIYNFIGNKTVSNILKIKYTIHFNGNTKNHQNLCKTEMLLTSVYN